MTTSDPALTVLTVDYCGEIYTAEPGAVLVIGRDADIAIDDNPFLHRHFLELSNRGDLWWLSNVGTMLSATVADEFGGLQAWLGPGARLPLVFPRTVVWFTAGPTTYELDVILSGWLFEPVRQRSELAGSVTVGRVSLTPDQHLLLVGLCEPVLRRQNRGGAASPTSNAVADRLGWTPTKFNRKLDNVCDKLARLGVRGLHGDASRLATSRKARLVEHALATQLVTAADLALLPAVPDRPRGS
jgi:HAMP domain-containing protein